MKHTFCLMTLLLVSALTSTRAHASIRNQQCVTDVINQFHNLPYHGLKSQFYDDDQIRKKKYRPGIRNSRKDFGFDNHFQTVQRIAHPNKKMFVILGSDFSNGNTQKAKADMFILGSNEHNNRLAEREIIGRWPFWHPGGSQFADNILAIPLENYKEGNVISKIEFFDFNEHGKAYKIHSATIKRDTGNNAQAVAFQRVNSGNYLLLVYYSGKLDLYLSKSPRLTDGFRGPLHTIPTSGRELGGSNINLIRQCDGDFYLITFNNTGEKEPVIKGDDIATLHYFNFDPNRPQVSPNIKFIEQRDFGCKSACSFKAGAGTYVDEDNNLRIYSVPYHRAHKRDFTVVGRVLTLINYLSREPRYFNVIEFFEAVSK